MSGLQQTSPPPLLLLVLLVLLSLSLALAAADPKAAALTADSTCGGPSSDCALGLLQHKQDQKRRLQQEQQQQEEEKEHYQEQEREQTQAQKQEHQQEHQQEQKQAQGASAGEQDAKPNFQDIIKQLAAQSQKASGPAVVPPLVHQVYTYGAPATHNQPFRNNADPSGCFPGLRSYTEDILGAFDEIHQIDAASIFNRYAHAYTPSLVLRWDRDSIYTPCTSGTEDGDNGHPDWPQTGGSVFQEWRLHGEQHYTDRLNALHLEGRSSEEDVSNEEPFASAKKFTVAAWRIYDTESNFKSHVEAALPGWQFVGRADYTYGDDEDAISLIQDSSSLECAVVFEGTNSFSELSTSTTDYTTGYCGYEGVHVGYRNELWYLTGDSWAPMKEKLQYCSKVTCLGHSLGGALCELFAACANSGHYEDEDYQRLAWKSAPARRLEEVVLPDEPAA